MSERPTGVRPEVIEQGRRIIEEDREFLDMLAEYDEGERTNTVDVQRESMNSQNTAQSDDVGLYATKQGGHEEFCVCEPSSRTGQNNACQVEPSMALSRALNMGTRRRKEQR